MSVGSDAPAPAALFDGLSAQRLRVEVRPWIGGLAVSGDLKADFARAELRLVEAGPRRTVLGMADQPDWRLVAEPPLPAEWLGGILRQDRLTRPHMARLAVAGSIVAGVAAAIWLAGGALLAAAAPLVPAVVTEPLGKAFVEQLAGERVCTTAEADAALRRLVDRLDPPRAVTVTIADWTLPNAFAGPGGQIILTRGLIEAASGPDEVAGVLAHEIGHVAHHHPTKALLRHYGVSLFAGALGGGYAQTADLGLMLAASREAEREADAYGLDAMTAARISPAGLAAFFERQRKPGPEATDSDAAGGLLKTLGSYATTHPSDEERLAEIRAAAERVRGTAALSAADWAALKAACRISRPARSGD
jgi:Zn-dependent protease with chaperone function